MSGNKYSHNWFALKEQQESDCQFLVILIILQYGILRKINHDEYKF